VKIKPKGKKATSRPKALPSQTSELLGWPAIARFLGMPNSTAHRWAKEGMPVRREGRNVVTSPEELNEWLQRTAGEAIGVHVVTPGSDLLKDLRASLAVQKSSKNSASQPKNESRSSRGTKMPKTKARQGAKGTYRDD
jgi:predicted DNA-binding transcriptional regulator AlpA